MCGRYASSRGAHELVDHFEIDEPPDEVLPPTYNVAPTDPVYAVVQREATRQVRVLRWGLVPSWAKDAKGAARLINARRETVGSKPAFRAAYARRRCLLPADGYYEWHTVGTTKTPHYITDPEAGEFAFAGLYSWWRAPVAEGAEPGPWVLTATILTRDSSGPTSSIHDRAPVMLPREVWDEWLDPTIEGDQSLVDMVVAESEQVLERLELHAVAPLRGDGPHLIEPIEA